MKKILTLLIVCFILIGCSSKTVSQKTDISISNEKIILVQDHLIKIVEKTQKLLDKSKITEKEYEDIHSEVKKVAELVTEDVLKEVENA